MVMGGKRAIFIVGFALAGILFVSSLAGAVDKQTLTGAVSDSMCGAQHMAGSPTACTRPASDTEPSTCWSWATRFMR